MVELTPVELANAAGGDPRASKQLVLSKRGISSFPPLAFCENLIRLDLSGNQLESLEPLDRAVSITWLNVRQNALRSLQPLSSLTNLRVLNAGDNQLGTMIHVRPLVALRALILNNNRIATIEGLFGMSELNTLVLSHNQITELAGVATLTSLTKLSLAHNLLRKLPDDVPLMSQLMELRLNDNKLVTISPCISKGFSLRLVDLGANRIKDIASIALLAPLQRLRNLNLIGNPMHSEGKYAESIKACCPTLHVLDGKNIARGTGKKSFKRGQDSKDHVGTSHGGDVAMAEEGEDRHHQEEQHQHASSSKNSLHPRSEKKQQTSGSTKRKQVDDTKPSVLDSKKVATAPINKKSRVESSNEEKETDQTQGDTLKKKNRGGINSSHSAAASTSSADVTMKDGSASTSLPSHQDRKKTSKTTETEAKDTPVTSATKKQEQPDARGSKKKMDGVHKDKPDSKTHDDSEPVMKKKPSAFDVLHATKKQQLLEEAERVSKTAKQRSQSSASGSNNNPDDGVVRVKFSRPSATETKSKPTSAIGELDRVGSGGESAWD